MEYRIDVELLPIFKAFLEIAPSEFTIDLFRQDAQHGDRIAHESVNLAAAMRGAGEFQMRKTDRLKQNAQMLGLRDAQLTYELAHVHRIGVIPKSRGGPTIPRWRGFPYEISDNEVICEKVWTYGKNGLRFVVNTRRWAGDEKVMWSPYLDCTQEEARPNDFARTTSDPHCRRGNLYTHRTGVYFAPPPHTHAHSLNWGNI